MKSDSFKDFVAEQLEGMGEISIRPMFGGYGIYRAKDFFGIIHKGRLYFKVSDKTRPNYEERGSIPFKPFRIKTLKSFYEVPADVLESRPIITDWAEESIHVANTKNRRSNKSSIRRKPQTESV